MQFLSIKQSQDVSEDAELNLTETFVSPVVF